MDWSKIIELAQGSEIIIEQVSFPQSGIRIQGSFEPPSIFNLNSDDQAFIAAFIQSHGSIKDMEQIFGVSYPTIKNRLNQLAKKFDSIEISSQKYEEPSDVLKQLEAGKINVNEALERLKK